MKKELTASPCIQQYSYEVESWGRLLTFYREELAYDKERLLALKNDNEDNEESFLSGKYQELFQAQERMIDFLWRNVREQARLLDEDFYRDAETADELERRQQELRFEFEDAEELFVRSKNQFLKSLNAFYLPFKQ